MFDWLYIGLFFDNEQVWQLAHWLPSSLPCGEGRLGDGFKWGAKGCRFFVPNERFESAA